MAKFIIGNDTTTVTVAGIPATVTTRVYKTRVYRVEGTEWSFDGVSFVAWDHQATAFYGEGVPTSPEAAKALLMAVKSWAANKIEHLDQLGAYDYEEADSCRSDIEESVSTLEQLLQCEWLDIEEIRALLDEWRRYTG